MMKVKKSKRVAVLFVLGLLICLFYLVSDTIITDAKAEPQEPPEEHTGNCLSYPVIFANDSMALRGTEGETTFEGEYDEDEVGTCWYLQQDPANEWRAQSAQGNGQVHVNWIDWGDSLEARPWTTNSIVRVETVLYVNVNSDPMIGYEMRHISGLGMDEMWGTNGVTYNESLPTVYASDAQITVQYLGDEIPEVLEWNPLTNTWSPYEPYAVVMNEPYSAEVNIKGKVINGCSWNVRTDGYDPGEGYYRITMSFDNETTKTNFRDAQIMVTTEASSEGGEEPAGGVAAVDVVNNLTYIDVLIESGKGSGGGGGQGPPSSKGSGSQ